MTHIFKLFNNILFLYYKASKSGALNLPFSADLLSILLDYLYSNEVPTLIGKKQQLIITFRIWLSMFCAVFSSKKSEFYKYWPKITSCRSNSYTNKMKSVHQLNTAISLSHTFEEISSTIFLVGLKEILCWFQIKDLYIFFATNLFEMIYYVWNIFICIIKYFWPNIWY